MQLSKEIGATSKLKSVSVFETKITKQTARTFRCRYIQKKKSQQQSVLNPFLRSRDINRKKKTHHTRTAAYIFKLNQCQCLRWRRVSIPRPINLYNLRIIYKFVNKQKRTKKNKLSV